ncbi:50S ribosomal subunit protein L21 [Candidatus Nasuia deltocephalinicola]|uniref:50S ribosomal protein L21 n=1 Tax=Candidatus Nasuia deltocephalincola TaxID=1160784 RepID=A0A0S2UPG3_9PROT|nr:50S ribosomal subunit protein L21 [Candidatus Nasuia deltocephalinicola]
MYAIIELLGKQYKIFKNIIIKTEKININKDSIIIINKILFFCCKNIIILDKFILNKIFFIGRVLKNSKKCKKINILKFNRRKGYKKKLGFKKKESVIIIEDLNLKILKYFLNGSKKIGGFYKKW